MRYLNDAVLPSDGDDFMESLRHLTREVEQGLQQNDGSQVPKKQKKFSKELKSGSDGDKEWSYSASVHLRNHPDVVLYWKDIRGNSEHAGLSCD